MSTFESNGTTEYVLAGAVPEEGLTADTTLFTADTTLITADNG